MRAAADARSTLHTILYLLWFFSSGEHLMTIEALSFGSSSCGENPRQSSSASTGDSAFHFGLERRERVHKRNNWLPKRGQDDGDGTNAQGLNAIGLGDAQDM
jgi:hypothetical protein